MIFIEGKTVPTGEGAAVRPMTLDDCIEWRNDLVDVTDAEELLDILIAEIQRLHTQAEAKTALGNLLAVIHGDGGHAVNRLGWAEACRQAEALVVEHFHSRHRAERREQRLRDLGIGDKP